MCEPKLICNKDGISLFKSVKDNEISFTNEFVICNQHFNLKDIMNENIFKLILVLNKDTFEQFHIIDENKEKQYIDFFILYKHVGKEYGIPKMCICFRLFYEYLDDKFRFITQTIKCPDLYLPNEKVEFIKDKGLSANIQFSTNGEKAYVNTQMILEKDDRVPIFMENIPGKLVKNIYLRLKSFIENLDNINYTV